MKFTPKDFNAVTVCPIELGMGKLEKEEFACHALNRHIEVGQPFEVPFQYTYEHGDMVPEWLTDHGEKKYTLTKKSLALLWAKFGKE